MAEDDAFTVNMLPGTKPSPPGGGTTDTTEPSKFSAADGNNVSFVNITYTIQPRAQTIIESLFFKAPPKKILDDVRYVKSR